MTTGEIIKKKKFSCSFFQYQNRELFSAVYVLNIIVISILVLY